MISKSYFGIKFETIISVLILVIPLLNCLNINNTSKIQYEQMLINDLFNIKYYNNKLRPSDTVQVKFSFNINQIIDIIEKNQIMVVNAFVDQIWNDNRLIWSNFLLFIINFIIEIYLF